MADNATISEISARIIDNYILQTGSGTVLAANGAGRDAVETIDAYVAEYTALLDDRVCEFCSSLDGMRFDLRTEEGLSLYEKYSPAHHNQCRCLFVFFLDGDPDIPETIGSINEGLEDKILERFKALNPGQPPNGGEWTMAKIARNYASWSLNADPQSWSKEITEIVNDEPGFIERRMKYALEHFKGYLGRLLSGDFVGEVDDYGMPI